MEQYPSNSHKPVGAKKEEAPVEKRIDKPAVTAAAKTKKNEMRKLTDIFISEDAANVKSYILLDVLVPAVKKAISDIVTNGIDMILYGGTGHSRKGTSASKVSYRDYYDRDGRRRDSGVARASSSNFSYDDIIFENRGDAENVLTEMENVIEKYGFVSVGDLYDLADVSTTNYLVNRYGWINLSGVVVVRDFRGGYVLKLPRAVPLNL